MFKSVKVFYSNFFFKVPFPTECNLTQYVTCGGNDIVVRIFNSPVIHVCPLLDIVSGQIKLFIRGYFHKGDHS